MHCVDVVPGVGLGLWESCASAQRSLAAMCMHLSCASNSMASDTGVQERECCNGALSWECHLWHFTPLAVPAVLGKCPFPTNLQLTPRSPGQLWGGEPRGQCMWVYPVGSFQLFLCVCADPTTDPGTGLYLPAVLHLWYLHLEGLFPASGLFSSSNWKLSLIIFSGITQVIPYTKSGGGSLS